MHRSPAACSISYAVFRGLMTGLAALSLLIAVGCDRNQGAVQSGSSNSGIRGSGVVKTQQRPIGPFTRIEVGGVIKLHWHADQQPSLAVAMEDNLLPLLVTEVVDSTLRIDFKDNVQPTKEVIVDATGPGLDELDGSGAADCDVSGIDCDRFALKLAGTSNCTISGSAKALEVNCEGASSFSGKDLRAGVATVRVSGTSRVQCMAADLESIEAAGASKAIVDHVDSKELNIRLSGTSDCTVSGKAKSLDVECQDASTFHGEEFTAEAARVATSGTSQATFQAVDLQSASAEAASHVTVSNVNAHQLKIGVSGTSGCTVSGRAEQLVITAQDAAAVHADGLKAQTVEIDAAGTAQVEVEAARSIGATAAAAATVRYRGNPSAVNVRASGTASVQKE